MDFIKKKYNTSNDDATIIVEAFLQTISELAQVKDGVIVQNLGKFEFKQKIVEKYVRDFQKNNGEIKKILKEDIYFTPSKTLRDL